jgi:hypothetical protein
MTHSNTPEMPTPDAQRELIEATVLATLAPHEFLTPLAIGQLCSALCSALSHPAPVVAVTEGLTDYQKALASLAHFDLALTALQTAVESVLRTRRNLTDAQTAVLTSELDRLGEVWSRAKPAWPHESPTPPPPALNPAMLDELARALHRLGWDEGEWPAKEAALQWEKSHDWQKWGKRKAERLLKEFPHLFASAPALNEEAVEACAREIAIWVCQRDDNRSEHDASAYSAIIRSHLAAGRKEGV